MKLLSWLIHELPAPQGWQPPPFRLLDAASQHHTDGVIEDSPLLRLNMRILLMQRGFDLFERE